MCAAVNRDRSLARAASPRDSCFSRDRFCALSKIPTQTSAWATKTKTSAAEAARKFNGYSGTLVGDGVGT